MEFPRLANANHMRQLEVSTPVKNFFLTGSDIASPGIVGAMMGGVASAAVLNGPLGLFKIIMAAKRHPTAVCSNALAPTAPRQGRRAARWIPARRFRLLTKRADLDRDAEKFTAKRHEAPPPVESDQR